MPLPVYHMRRILAITTVVLILVVAGMYFSARLQIRDVRKDVPNKIGYDIKQTANGFQFSKSDGKRTLFSIQASDLKEFKLNGRAELHNVTILLYGRDSSRFDQIYGDDFAYDPKTGEVTAKGDVQIDLVANPAGLASPDQSTPQELKNPIHLKTRDLVFNKDTGNASTDARVEFSAAQATGWAVGVQYAGKTNTLTLTSQIHVILNGENAAAIEAAHGVITGDPREVVLDHPHLDRQGGLLQADQAIFHLGQDNNVERVQAIGNVIAENRVATGKAAPQAGQTSEIRTHSDEAELLLTGKQDLLRTAVLTGHVHVEQSGAQPIEGDAGRVLLEFQGQNQLQKVHALDGARLAQKATGVKPSGASSGPQDFELTATAIDFDVAEGHILDRAETSGAAQITISSSSQQAQETPTGAAQASPSQRTVVTAAKFVAKLSTDDRSKGQHASGIHLSSIHGAPEARIVSSTAGQPDRVSTSDSVDATFLAQGGIDSVTQLGNVAYTDSQSPDKRTQAWADRAHYIPSDQMLVLTGNPRIASISTATTAKTIRINRATGAALAEGDVKSTYSELKEQPNGALLASSSPIHVTARTMTAGSKTGLALYTGNVRLWQDANIIEAPSIEFDRDHRFVTAQGESAMPVLTTLIQPTKPTSKPESAATGKGRGQAVAGPITIASTRLTYADSERRVHYEGGVDAKCADFSVHAKTADAYLLPRSQTSSNQSFAGPGQLDRMVAQDGVSIQQPNRRAEGQKLVYTAAEDKFVLTGGPPSIFDAEQGKITGVSLTFFRGDDRVLVEGGASTPVVTQTRVAQ